MLVVRGYPADVRLLHAVLRFKLGFWTGMLAAGALMKRTFPSHGDAESDEVALVAILDGVAVKSRAQAFRGGSMFSWLGGIAVDLREAQFAPDATLRLEGVSAFGGIAVGAKPAG